MSPMQAAERSYVTLKRMLREGIFAPGARLEANRIADQLGVSMTPVRDSLHRLAGERLIEATSGEGFHVLRYSEGELRDLYEWHSALVTIAVRTAPSPVATSTEDEAGTTLADKTFQVFHRLASMAPNREIRAAIAVAADRLHPFRMLESQILEPILGELDELEAPGAALPQAIRRYHLRRMKVASHLLECRNRS